MNRLLLLFFLTFLFFGCTKDINYKWSKTIDERYLLWIPDLGYEYLWEGGQIENIANGKGKLTIIKEDSIVEISHYSQRKPLFYGAIDEKSIKKIEEDFYVGDNRDLKFHGFGVYVKPNKSVIYIGEFKNGLVSGKSTKYKNGKIKYKGGWLYGEKNGLGTFYQSDGTTKEGFWKKGKLDSLQLQQLNFKDGIYKGHVVNGTPNGNGKIIYNDSSKYIGNWQDGKRHNLGVYISKNGDTIDGNWSNNKLEGLVSYVTNSQEYEGYYRNDKKDGFGSLILKNGTMYSGDWKNGKASGFGEYIDNNGVSYDGEWLNGLPQGLGTYAYLALESYKGEWYNGKPEGIGVFKCSDYNYEGHLSNGIFNGFGKINYKETGDYYNGYFKEGLKDSIGEYNFNSGNNYKGIFKKDQFDGLGIFTFKDGSNYQGEFSNGLFYGQGTLTLKQPEGDVSITGNWNGDSNFPNVASILFSNGDLYEGPLVNGKPTKQGLWSSKEERLLIEKGEQLKQENTSLSDRFLHFYTKNKKYIDDVLDKTTLILDAVEVVALTATAVLAPTGVGGAIAGSVFGVVKGLNIAAHSLKVGLSALDVINALGGGEKGKEIMLILKKYIIEIKNNNPQLYDSLINLENINSDILVREFKKFAIANGVDEVFLNNIDQVKLESALKSLAIDTAMLALSAIPGLKLGKSISKTSQIVLKSIKSQKKLGPLFKLGQKYQKTIAVNLQKGVTKSITKVGGKSIAKGEKIFLKKSTSNLARRSSKNIKNLKNKRNASNKLDTKIPKNKVPKRNRKDRNKDGIPYKLVSWLNKQRLKVSNRKKINITLKKNKRSITIKYNGVSKARAYAIGSKIVISVAGHFDGNRKINPVILGPLVRKATYKVNSAIYFTDNRCRPKKAILPIITKGMILGEVKRTSIKGATESGIAQEHDREDGGIDDGGHLIAHTLGGVKANINIVPQYRKMNRGPFKIIETFVKKHKLLIKMYTVGVDYSTKSYKFRPNNFYQSFIFRGDKKLLEDLQKKLFLKDQVFKFKEVDGIYKCSLGTSNDVTEIIKNTILKTAA